MGFPKYLFEQDLMVVGFAIIYFVALAVSVGWYKTVRSVASTYSGRQGSIGDVHIDYSVLGRFHALNAIRGPPLLIFMCFQVVSVRIMPYCSCISKSKVSVLNFIITHLANIPYNILKP